MNYSFTVMESLCGPIGIFTGRSGVLEYIEFLPTDGNSRVADHLEAAGCSLTAGRQDTGIIGRQLEEYFAGKRRRFELESTLRGTDFQQQVWQALRKIPYGSTRSYGEIAKAIGNPGASRAVGAACRANPIPIVIPCHRVVGADGSLVGFGAGLVIKKFLLMLEVRYRPHPSSGQLEFNF